MPRIKLDTVDDVLNEVGEIFRAPGDDLQSFLHKQIVLNALKCKRDGLETLDLKIINRAVAEFRYAARVFKP